MKTRLLINRAAVGASSLGLLVACGGAFGEAGSTGAILGSAACPELEGGAMNASFEADAHANATIRTFVTASGDLAAVAARAEAEVSAACGRIAHDLGASDAELSPHTRGEPHSAAACRIASARIDAIVRRGAHAQLQAQVTPPACQVRGEVEAQCKAQCAGSIDPGYVKTHCQAGHLYGRCEGQCSGACQGGCNGTMSGGHCEGRCAGDCHGGCSVDLEEPKCDVAMQAPRADAHCDGSCKAHADLEAQCTPARAEVRASVETGEMARLLATLRANLPALVHVEVAYGGRIAGDVDMLVRTGAELPHAFGQLTAHAGACMAAAANACVSAQASLRVSVQASASVSAKAGAHAGG